MTKTTITFLDAGKIQTIKESTDDETPFVIAPGDRIEIGFADKVVYGGSEDWRLLSFKIANGQQNSIEVAIAESVWRQFIAEHLGGDASLFGRVVAGDPKASCLKPVGAV